MTALETTRLYDYNVWSQEPNELCLTACELEYSTSNTIQTNYDQGHYHTITFTFPQDAKEIEYLLQDLAINHYPFTDYDAWEDNPTNLNGETPEKIATFLDSLPNYVITTNGGN